MGVQITKNEVELRQRNDNNLNKILDFTKRYFKSILTFSDNPSDSNPTKHGRRFGNIYDCYRSICL